MSDPLYQLTLKTGLRTTRDGREIYYRRVNLREITVGDERRAVHLSERVVSVAGVPRLMSSDHDYRLARTMLHIESFEVDGQKIPHQMLDLDLIGQLSPADWALIEQRVFVVELAVEVRAGNMDQSEFDAILAGTVGPQSAPQPPGPVAGAGASARVGRPGPGLLSGGARHGSAGTDQGLDQGAGR